MLSVVSMALSSGATMFAAPLWPEGPGIGRKPVVDPLANLFEFEEECADDDLAKTITLA